MLLLGLGDNVDNACQVAVVARPSCNNAPVVMIVFSLVVLYIDLMLSSITNALFVFCHLISLYSRLHITTGLTALL